MTTNDWLVLSRGVKTEVKAAGLLAALIAAEKIGGTAMTEVWELSTYEAMMEPGAAYRAPFARLARAGVWWRNRNGETLKCVGYPVLTEIGSALDES